MVVAIGRLKAGPERELFERYAKRAAAIAASVGVAGVEFRELEESRAREPAERRAAEGRALMQAVPKGAYLCALDERGAVATSAGWAQEIAKSRDAGAPAYALVIGGPDGLDEAVRRAARALVGFGALTWPHQLVRVMAAEQVYRVLTIMAGHPYHRA